MTRLKFLLISLFLSPLLSLITLQAAGMTAEQTAEEATQEAMRQAQQYLQQGGSIPTLPDPIQLKESDITGTLKVLPQLRAMGIDAEQTVNRDLGNMTQGMQLNQQAMALLKRNGFTAERFQQSVYSIGLAMAGLQTDTDELAGAAEQSEQALAEMEGQMSPEQLAMIRQQLGAALGTVNQLQSQPEGNLALVKKYQAQIEAAFDGD